MPRRPCDPLTVVDHHRYGQLLQELRRRVAVITRVTFNGRVRARVLDAALHLERQLTTLCLRLADAVDDDITAAGAYVVEAPEVAPAPRPPTRRLSVDEHRLLGAQLYRLRNEVMALATALGHHFRKSSRVGRTLHKPERALDRLRCRLDDLFCAQHPEQFDTRVYYPGSSHRITVETAVARTEELV